MFTGNTDRNTIVYHDLNPPIKARYIRFRPMAWFTHITMRVELYGCLLGIVENSFIYIYVYLKYLDKECSHLLAVFARTEVKILKCYG